MYCFPTQSSDSVEIPTVGVVSWSIMRSGK